MWCKGCNMEANRGVRVVEDLGGLSDLAQRGVLQAALHLLRRLSAPPQLSHFPQQYTTYTQP